MDKPLESLSNQQTQTVVNKSKYKKKKCIECNKRRKTSNENHQICHICYAIKTNYSSKQSGNKTIDDFIRYTQIHYAKAEGRMEFVPYDQFKDIKFIAEGGFSKIYKAAWIDGPVYYSNACKSGNRLPNYPVVLKRLNNSKNVTSKELNEVCIIA